MVEQWSEESRTPRFVESHGNSRLMLMFSLEEQWSKQSIVLKCGGQVRPFAFDEEHSIRELVHQVLGPSHFSGDDAVVTRNEMS